LPVLFSICVGRGILMGHPLCKVFYQTVYKIKFCNSKNGVFWACWLVVLSKGKEYKNWMLQLTCCHTFSFKIEQNIVYSIIHADTLKNVHRWLKHTIFQLFHLRFKYSSAVPVNWSTLHCTGTDYQWMIIMKKPLVPPLSLFAEIAVILYTVFCRNGWKLFFYISVFTSLYDLCTSFNGWSAHRESVFIHCTLKLCYNVLAVLRIIVIYVSWAC
jgi:hypothetical protein